MDFPKSDSSIGLVGGRFIDENPVTGQVGSIIPAAWANSVMDELLAIITQAGLTPDESTLDQVVTAIRKPASDTFAGVAYLATIAEGKAGTDAEKIITAAILKAVLDDRPGGIRRVTFAEAAALTADEGPIIVTDRGGFIWQWADTAFFTGYRSPLCGKLDFGWTPTPLPWQVEGIGGTLNETDHGGLIARFRESGLTVALGSWVAGEYKIADMGGGEWKAPDMRDQFLRFTGTDADTANARVLGSFQSDALQNLIGSFGSIGYTPSGAFFADTSKPGYEAMSATSLGRVSFDASRIARTSSETRSANTAFTPVINL